MQELGHPPTPKCATTSDHGSAAARLVTETGAEVLSDFPYEDDLLHT